MTLREVASNAYLRDVLTLEGRIVAAGPNGLTRQERRERIDVTAEGVTIEANPSSTPATNNTTVLNQIIPFAAAKERDVWIAGKVAVNGSIDLASEVRVIGRGAAAYATLDSDIKGSGLFWRGGASGTLINFGKADQVAQVVGASLENLVLEGNSEAGVTLVSIRSNTPTNPLYVTKFGLLRGLVLSQAGIGIQWGDATNDPGTNEEQSDYFVLEQINVQNMATRGLVIDAANAADNSFFRVCNFSNCAPAGSPYIEIKRGGYIQFVGCTGGGDANGARDFVQAGQFAGGLAFAWCQSEGMRNFLHVAAANISTQQAIYLQQCILNDNVHVQGLRYLVGVANEWFGGKLILDRAGCAYQGDGDLIGGNNGSFVIEKTAGGNFSNRRTPLDTTNEYLNRGEIIQLAVPVAGTGAYQQVVARTGQRRTARANSTAYTGTGGGFLTWKPGEAIAINDVRLPSIPDGKKYTAQTAGTTGATAADEPIWDPVRTVTDAAGITWTPTTNTNPTLHTVSPDNGRAYRLLVAGTSDASLPGAFTGTALGDQVVDGTATWQDTGPSALVVSGNLTGTALGDIEIDGALNHDGTTVGFYGVAPVTRPTAYTQTYATADKTHAAYTPDDESAAYTGIDNLQSGTVYATVADLNALRVAYENLRATTEDAKNLINSVIDDLQALGMVT